MTGTEAEKKGAADQAPRGSGVDGPKTEPRTTGAAAARTAAMMQLARARRLARLGRTGLPEGSAAATGGIDAMAAARQMEGYSQASNVARQRDEGRGEALPGIGEELEEMAGLAGDLSQSELMRGLEVAAVAGQVSAVGRALEELGLATLATFMTVTGEHLEEMAVAELLRSQETKALALAIISAGRQVEVHGTEE